MRNFKLLFLLMAAIALSITGCKDDDDDDDNGGGSAYTQETMSGTFENVVERIKVELSSDGSAILTKVEGDHAGQDEEVDDAATWTIDNYETPPGVPGDNPLSIIVEHTNSEFDEPYVLIIKATDTLVDHWQKILTRVDAGGGDGGGDDDDTNYTEEDMAARWQASNGLFYELSAGGSAVVGQYSEAMGEDEITDENATWEITTVEWTEFDPTTGEQLDKSGEGIKVTHTDGYDEMEISHNDTIIDHYNDYTYIRQGGGDDGGGDDAGDFQFAPDADANYADMQLGMISGGASGELENHPTWVFKADGYADYYENGIMVTGTEDTPDGFPWKYEDGKLIVADFAERPSPKIELEEQTNGTFTSQKFDSDPEAVWEEDAGATDPSDIGGDYTMDTLAGKWYKDNIGNSVWYEFYTDGTYVDYSGDLSGDWTLDGTTISMSGDLSYTWIVKEIDGEVVFERDGDPTEKLYSEDALVNGGDGGSDGGGDDGGGDEFDLYTISYFDKIEFVEEIENSHGDMQKEWKITSTEYPNMSMSFTASSANSNGETISNATYDLGMSSSFPSGGASLFIYDSDETDGWSYEILTTGSVTIENSTSSGCTITINDTWDAEHDFSGTAEVTF